MAVFGTLRLVLSIPCLCSLLVSALMDAGRWMAFYFPVPVGFFLCRRVSVFTLNVLAPGGFGEKALIL